MTRGTWVVILQVLGPVLQGEQRQAQWNTSVRHSSGVGNSESQGETVQGLETSKGGNIGLSRGSFLLHVKEGGRFQVATTSCNQNQVIRLLSSSYTPLPGWRFESSKIESRKAQGIQSDT